MEIRKARKEDLDQVMQIYAVARRFMKESGNPNQWGDNHPPRELIADDIDEGICHVAVEGGRVCGVFALLFGEDPTYKVIDGGSWLNDNPYATIHRIASDGSVPGVLKRAVEYATSHISDVRMDTHSDNKKMQYLLSKYGFQRCGTIYLADGRPRIAYHLSV